jgi:hypothetical protein
MVHLQSFHNTHHGERCFLIGNGPSLKQMDLSPLKKEITFGLNRIYLLFPQIGFPTTFLVTINKFVMEQFGSELVGVPSIKFLNWYYRKSTFPTKDIIYIRPGLKSRFSTNPVIKPVWEGATVTYVAMQLAYYMGFSKVILIGVDHSFQSHGNAHQLVTSIGDDPDHFDPQYFGKGVRWQLPDLATSEHAYRLAKQYFEADRREILDATIGGNLSIFKKVKYQEII